MDYSAFIESKSQLDANYGFKPTFMPSILKDFQAYQVDWSLVKGRSAIINDCGMGKTLMELVWAQNVIEHTNKPVLLCTPIAVGEQMLREAEKFGIQAKRSRDGKSQGKCITVTNYEQLHKFDWNDFAGMVCDESSILKNFKGALKEQITRFMLKYEYRLLATATAAPNDFTELGTSSEALGYLGYMDMLNKWFKNTQNDSKTGMTKRGELVRWRFKGHSEDVFWRWVVSWARAARKPSDLGNFDDTPYVLPELIENIVHIDVKPMPGMLFALPAIGLAAQREERKYTVQERCEAAANLVNSHNEPAIVWCDYNPEGDLLESLIPDSVQVKGANTVEKNEEFLTSFANGESRVLVIKPKIGAFGLNFQHCGHHVFFPNHSYEQRYQGIRRSLRFGRVGPVKVDTVATAGGEFVLKNFQRKQKQADEMFNRLVAEMNNSLSIERNKGEHTNNLELPNFL